MGKRTSSLIQEVRMRDAKNGGQKAMNEDGGDRWMKGWGRGQHGWDELHAGG